MRFPLALLPLLAVAGPLCPVPAAAAEPQFAQGVVYHDVDGDRQRDAGERGLAKIKVSNGQEIVETDAQGRYRIPVTDDTILFVIKPRNWATPLNAKKLPQFYYIHKPNGSPASRFAGVSPTGPLPESVDFPLRPQKEPDQFKAIIFGDPQPRDVKEVDYISHDVVQELIGTDASFGVTLGDIVFDDLKVFQPLTDSVALIGIPWYNVLGNHDVNMDAKEDRYSDETFERIFGPSYYSFDYGPVHFMVLDDVKWFVPEGAKRGTYRGGLGERQMQFIRNDLERIPADQLIVLMMHIPLLNVEDRSELYRLIEKRPFSISMSAHTHTHEHHFIDEKDGWMGAKPHHHIINVTVSGSWWSGAPDERGIPHTTMADGAPNGYSILSFDGAKYKLDYKVAGRPRDYQLRIHAPSHLAVDQLAESSVYVNVFNGSKHSQVEMRVDEGGVWIPLKQVVERDPTFAELSQRENGPAVVKTYRNLPKPGLSTHLWKGSLPASLGVGTHLIHVRTKDMFGRTFDGRRTIRITEQLPAASK